MRFYMSGSAADGGVATSNDIYLPFYDKGWWSVMLQRDQHVSASNNTTATTYTLYAKNKINNGFDGNSIGFEGSASIVSNVSESINNAWNEFTIASGGEFKSFIHLGGKVNGSTVGGITTNHSGKMFSGSFQEFRYLSNAIPETKFNDYVMNPESIEGNNITGSQSSFDLVNFRAPLGNELESTFTPSTSGSATSIRPQSSHPAIQGNANILITSSFYNTITTETSSTYTINFYQNDDIYPYSRPNTEVYFLDQPAIGFRNRISNKIQVKDGSTYGNILSNRISIQQDYQISQSYTENINNLEVAFSLQDEVNDDIIASFGYGVVADAIADPRFVSSSDDYYPQLRKIAEDYFKKYTEGNAHDYLRLIGYFDNSIFKAIKSYVPARTSVSTGIVIKQHMLERNRFPPIQISEGTTVAITPSGSLNTPLIFENIVLTSSIDIVNEDTSTGGSGGSLTKFNYVGNQFLQQSGPNQGAVSTASFGEIPISQSWDDNIATIAGLETFVRNEQSEFYDGEFSGSELTVTTQSLLDNPYTQIVELEGTISTSTNLTPNITSNTLSPLAAGTYTINASGIPAVGGSELGFLNITISIVGGSFSSISTQSEVSTLSTFLMGDTITIQGNTIPREGSPSVYAGVIQFTITENILTNPFLPSIPQFVYNQSVYYPTVNNALENRPNTDRYVIENQFGANTTSNLQLILSGSATKAQTPNSNYTTEKIIIPRYLGNKISSADYNFYTSASATVSFLDGTTGSWAGDNSYGNTAVIDKNPIYFAHFQSSRENLELYGTYTFDVDQLIEIPFENITKESLTIPPVTLKIDGSNKNLLTTSNVFEKNRGVTVSYESQTTVNDVSRVNNISTTPTVTSESLTTDYSTLNVGDNRIYQGGLEYLTISTTQPTPTTYLRSMSFDVGNNIQINTGSKSQFGTGELVGDEFITYLTSSRFADAFSSINTVEFGSTKWAETGSGYIDLLGGAAALDVNLFVLAKNSVEQEYYGPSLALMHTYNYWLRNQINYSSFPSGYPPNTLLTSSYNKPGLPIGSVSGDGVVIDSLDNNNYFRFNPTSTQSGANAFGYTDSNPPFLLQRGDEIRVTYNLLQPQLGLRTFADQDFTVTEVGDNSPDGDYSDVIIFPFDSDTETHGIQNTRVYNRIHVTPDPSTLSQPILDGEIYNFTVRRRVNADDRVIVYQTPPQNSFGSQTLSPGGYLIPEDLTLIQKDNVNTLINQLKAQSVLPKQSSKGNNNSSNTNTE